MASQTYQLVITGNLSGQFVQNVFHWRIDDAAAPTRLQAAKSLITGFIAAGKAANFLDCLCESYSLLSIKARAVSGGTGPEYIDLSLSGTTGTRTGQCQASSAGPVVLWFTDGPTRRVGKTFLPGIRIGDVQGGEIAAAAITVFLTKMNLFRASFTTTGLLVTTATFVIPKATDMATRSLVIQCNISKNIGDQRRRLLPV